MTWSSGDAVAWRSVKDGAVRTWGRAHSASFRRTAIGFDTYEQLLDVVLEPDLSAWKLKDEDELEWAVGLGDFTPDEAAAIRTEASRAIDLVLRSVPPC